MKKAEEARKTLVPAKSETLYNKEYRKYIHWLEQKGIPAKNSDETVLLAYFQEMVR